MPNRNIYSNNSHHGSESPQQYQHQALSYNSMYSSTPSSYSTPTLPMTNDQSGMNGHFYNSSPMFSNSQTQDNGFTFDVFNLTAYSGSTSSVPFQQSERSAPQAVINSPQMMRSQQYSPTSSSSFSSQNGGFTSANISGMSVNMPRMNQHQQQHQQIPAPHPAFQHPAPATSNTSPYATGHPSPEIYRSPSFNSSMSSFEQVHHSPQPQFHYTSQIQHLREDQATEFKIREMQQEVQSRVKEDQRQSFQSRQLQQIQRQLNVNNNRLQHQHQQQHQQQQYPQKNGTSSNTAGMPVNMGTAVNGTPPVNYQAPQNQRSRTLNSVSPTLEKFKRNQKPKSASTTNTNTKTTASRGPSASKVQKPYPKAANTQQRTPAKKQSKEKEQQSQLQTPPQSQSQTEKQSQAPTTPTATPNPLQFQKYRSLFTGSTDRSQSITSQAYDSTMEKAKLLTQGILSAFQYEENLQQFQNASDHKFDSWDDVEDFFSMAFTLKQGIIFQIVPKDDCFEVKCQDCQCPLIKFTVLSKIKDGNESISITPTKITKNFVEKLEHHCPRVDFQKQVVRNFEAIRSMNEKMETEIQIAKAIKTQSWDISILQVYFLLTRESLLKAHSLTFNRLMRLVIRQKLLIATRDHISQSELQIVLFSTFVMLFHARLQVRFAKSYGIVLSSMRATHARALEMCIKDGFREEAAVIAHLNSTSLKGVVLEDG